MWSPLFRWCAGPPRTGSRSLRPGRGSLPSPPGQDRHRQLGSVFWPRGNYRHRARREMITGSARPDPGTRVRSGSFGCAEGVVAVVGTIVTVVVLVLVVAGAVW